MKYQIILSPQADADFEWIYSWIAETSPEGAVRWYFAYKQAKDKVKENPFQFGIAAESKRLKIELRDKLFKTPAGHKYRIVYLIDGDAVNILRIRGKGQAPLRCSDVHDKF